MHRITQLIWYVMIGVCCFRLGRVAVVMNEQKQTVLADFSFSQEEHDSTDRRFLRQEALAGTHELTISGEVVALRTSVPSIPDIIPIWNDSPNVHDIVMHFDVEQRKWSSVDADQALEMLNPKSWRVTEDASGMPYPQVFGIGHAATKSGFMTAWVAGMVWTKGTIARDAFENDAMSPLERIEPDLHFEGTLPKNLKLLWVLTFMVGTIEDAGVADTAFHLAEPMIAIGRSERELRATVESEFKTRFNRAMSARETVERKADARIGTKQRKAMVQSGIPLAILVWYSLMEFLFRIWYRRKYLTRYSPMAMRSTWSWMFMGEKRFAQWVDHLEERLAEAERVKQREATEERLKEQREAKKARKERSGAQEKIRVETPPPMIMKPEVPEVTWRDALRLEVELHERIDRLPEYEREPMLVVCDEAMEERKPSRALAKLKHFEGRLKKIEEDRAAQKDDEDQSVAAR